MSAKKIPKKNYKKKGGKKSIPNNKQLATRIKKLEKQDELKYADLYSTSTADGGVQFVLTSLAQGDNFDQRIGEEVIAKYIHMKFLLTRTIASNAAAATRLRLLLFWDVQANGVASPMYTSTSSLTEGVLDDSVIASRTICPRNYRTKNRYHILMDKLVIMNLDDIGCNMQKLIKKNISLGGAKIKYSDSGATIAAQTSRSLQLFAISGTADTISAQWSFRFWYTDP